MNKRSWKLATFILMVFAVFSIDAVMITAQTRREVKEQRHKERVALKEHSSYRQIIVNKRTYFYREGIFYEKRNKNYFVITAPAGARITVLPRGYNIVRIKRVRYYVFNGIYYRYIPREKAYEVIERPL